MYIGVEDVKGDILYLEKHDIQDGESEIVVNVKGLPHKASIDPLHILVDKNPDDNYIRVSKHL